MATELEIVVATIFDNGGWQVVERATVLQERTVVLDRPLKCLPREIQPVELGIALLELGQDAQRLGIVVETAERLHRRMQRLFACMTERRMAEIVGERHRLAEILVEPQSAADGACDLRDLERMGEPRTVVIALVIDENLRLVLQ